jgi:hypothetical protein
MTMTADWSIPALTDARRRGDPLARAAVNTAFGLDDDIAEGTRKMSELMQLLIRHGGLPHAAFPAPVSEFVHRSATVPPWYDEELVRLGEEVFMEHGVLSLASLLHASLPECYLMERGVHVLWMTQQLEQHVFRRLIETAQMVVSVMSPGGIRASEGRLTGPGVEIAQKVRLMHETMRHLILDAPVGTPDAPALRLSDVMTRCAWARQELGAPINQEDMAYTLLTFGYVIPRSLVRLGVPLTPREQEAILHAWNVVGHVMGVEAELIAHTMADAERLYATIQRTQAAGSVIAHHMTASLITAVRGQLPGGILTDWIPPVLIEFLCGRRAARMLGLQRMGLRRWLLEVPLLVVLRVVLAVEQRLFGRSRAGRRALLRFGETVVHALASFPRGERDGSFDIPREVARSWGLTRS